MRVKIINDVVTWHTEIIASLIENVDNIVKKPCNEIVLQLHPKTDKTFIEYITNEYDHVTLSSDKCDYNIHATFYPKDFNKFNRSDFYICHEFNHETLQHDNIFYLTPLAGKNYIKPCVMPPITRIQANKPVYAAQGNMVAQRRNFDLVRHLLSHTSDLDYVMRFMGRGNLPKDIKEHPKVEYFRGLPHKEYHDKFSDVYCLMPLVTKSSHPHYYRNKFTTSIMYAQGYDLTTVIDKDLNDIYKLDKAYTFSNKPEMVDCFRKSYNEFIRSNN
jgi:hypothetical protein